MSKSRKENLQNKAKWRQMSAELILARKLLSHIMMAHQDIVPKTISIHPHYDVIINHLDKIRETALKRMALNGGFGWKTADDCFYPILPPSGRGEREVVDLLLKQALTAISDMSELSETELSEFWESLANKIQRSHPD